MADKLLKSLNFGTGDTYYPSTKWENVEDAPTIPTKTSELTNDSGFITINDIPEQEEVDLSEYAKKSEVPTKTSQLTNDSGYLTQHQSLTDYAKKSELPTKVSQLTNDSGYITSIPSEYVTDSELNAKGYLTQHQSLSAYSTTAQNDAKYQPKGSYLTSIPSEYVTETELTAKGYQTVASADSKYQTKGSYLTSIPSEYITETELSAKKYLTSIPSEYITESELSNMEFITIGDIDTICTPYSGDLIGYVDSSNIVLVGGLTGGTYSIKYELEDGRTINIGDLVLDDNIYYSIQNKLTACTTNNSATSITKDSSYSATITANSGYELNSLVVTMGGTNVTSSVVSGNKVTITNVTGNIVITAIAEVKVVEPVTVDIGLTKDRSIELTAGAIRDSASAGFVTTDFIDVSNLPKPITIELTGTKWVCENSSETGYIRFFVTDTSGTKLVGDYTYESKMPSGVTMVVNDTTYRRDVTVTITGNNIGQIRFAGRYTSTELAIESYEQANPKATLTYTPN